MQARISLVLSLLLLGPPSFAQTDSSGLVLGFSADAEVRRTEMIANARPAPQRATAGVAWRIEAVAADGSALWSRSFPAPRRFHGGSEAAISFSVSVPTVPSGTRLVMVDDTGRTLWGETVASAALDRARLAQRRLARELQKGYAATGKLQSQNASAALAAKHAAHALALGKNGLHAADEQRAALQVLDATLERKPVAPVLQSHDKARPMFNLGGTSLANNVDVRVFDAASGKFVVSDRPDWFDSRFDFQLPMGRYVLEIDDNRLNIDSDYFFRKPYRTGVVKLYQDTELLEVPQETERGTLAYTARFPCSLLGETHVFRPRLTSTLTADVTSADGTRIARTSLWRGVRVTPPDPASTGEYCPVKYEFGLSPGRYTVRVAVPGWEAVSVDVQIAHGESVARDHTYSTAARTLVWRGTVVDATGSAMTMVRVQNVNLGDQPPYIDFLTAEQSGRFEIAYNRDWVVEFSPTWLGNRASVVSKRQVLDGGALPSVVVLDDVALENTMDDGLLRIHGNGDREDRINVLFLAEGYTDITETYTDTNSNGVWDGIVWYDLDGDGVYNGAHDRREFYGSTSFSNIPEPDPSSANEPFTDLNRDGMLTVGDPAQFELNARDFMRSLLGSDFWDQHRSGFNAYLFFEPSAQAGSDVTTPTGQLSVQRDTRYGANLVLPRLIMDLDRQAAMTRALAVLPEVDMVVVLVNQTVFTLARGNVTIAQPGTMVWPSGLSRRAVAEIGPSHEMGHYVGSLCDEYSEYSGVHPLQGTASIWCPNASYVHEVDRVPWANWVPAGAASPTRNLDASIGIYEGADYYSGGAYRPSFDSTMRSNAALFNVPSRAALEAAMRARTGPSP